LIGSQPAVDVLKHFLQEIYQLVYFDVVTQLPSRVVDARLGHTPQAPGRVCCKRVEAIADWSDQLKLLV
jgi:hypothetical protein